MRIKYLFEKLFQIADPYAGIESINKRLRDNSFLVVLDGDSFLGILTASDIIKSPHQLVIDCMHDRSRVDPDQDIESVLMLMKKTRSSVLPVFKGDEFIGVVTRAAIANYLSEYRNELKREIFERTAELSEANEQLKREIEDRKRAEEAFRETSDYLENLIDYANAPIIVWDSEFRITRFNHAFEHMTGYRTEEVIGQTLDILFPEENCEKYMRKIGWTSSGEHWESIEIPIVCTNNSIRLALWNLANIYTKDGKTFLATIAQGHDITDRKRSEDNLRESESRFREMAELLPTIIWEMDTSLRITYSNNMGFQTFDYAKEELDAGIKGMDLLHPDYKKVFARRIEQVIKGVNIGPMEYRMLRKDGSEIFTMVHAALMHKGGRTTGFRLSISDITEQKRLRHQLDQSRKMEAIATLAGGIAHQFNNSLSSIAGYTELLEVEFPDNGKMMDYIKLMKESVHRMIHLASQLLAYARGGRYNPQAMLLNEYVKDTLTLIQHTLGPNIRVETDLSPDILNVEADRTQMQMVISAIIANADEAIDGPGRVRITTKNVAVDQDFIKDYPGLTPGRYACFSVKDDGNGMDKETKKRIFEPFFTTHFMGRGLGMASVYGIVTNHGGIISVDSKPGKGTEVIIYLPALDVGKEVEDKIEERIVPSPAIDLHKVERTVLLVEDEKPLLELFRKILEKIGYRILEAGTGEKAVEIAKTFDGDIDFALLDIKLPDIDGSMVYSLIVEARPNLKVILCSGDSIDGPARKILGAGAQAFIQKPFLISTLAKKLKEISESAK